MANRPPWRDKVEKSNIPRWDNSKKIAEPEPLTDAERPRPRTAATKTADNADVQRPSFAGSRRAISHVARPSARHGEAATGVEHVGSSGKIPDTPELTDPNGRVSVFVRIRPLDEAAAAGHIITGARINHLVPEGTVRCVRPLPGFHQLLHSGGVAGDKAFTYDGVFDEQASQEKVYAALGRPVLHDVLAGMHGCVMAYGQTGSGKTHSLLETGTDVNGTLDTLGCGLVPRLISELFISIASDYQHEYDVQVAMFQIYNEQVDDLLNGEQQNLKVRQDQHTKMGWYVEQLTWRECKTPESLIEAFDDGRKRLKYAETHMNKHSSRSHAVMQLKVAKRPQGTCSAASPGGDATFKRLMGKMTIVDLAGSERVKKSQHGMLGTKGDTRFKEATNINTSLLAMGNVVQALAKQQAHVPFRDSNLTRVLEGSLGGLCRTSLLVCVAPEMYHATETQSTLEFAARAIAIVAKPVVFQETVSLDPKALANGLAEVYRIEALERIEAARRDLQSSLSEARQREMAALGSAHEAEALAHQLASQLESQVAQEKSLQSKLEEQQALHAEMANATETERQRHAREKDELRAAHAAELQRVIARTAAVVQQQTAAIQRLQEATGAERAALIASASAASLAATEMMQAQAAVDEVQARMEAARRDAQAEAVRLLQAHYAGGGTGSLMALAEAVTAQRAAALEAARSEEAALEQAHAARAARRMQWETQNAALSDLLESSAARSYAEAPATAAGVRAAVLAAEEAAAREGAAVAALVQAEGRAMLADAVLREQLTHEVHLERTLAATQAAFAEMEAHDTGLVEQVRLLQSDLERFELSTLRNGTVFTKRSRNNRLAPRAVRCVSADLRAVEWARLGAFHHGMPLHAKQAFSWVGDEVVVEGPERPLTLQVATPTQRAWVKVLEARTSGAEPPPHRKPPPPAPPQAPRQLLAATAEDTAAIDAFGNYTVRPVTATRGSAPAEPVQAAARRGSLDQAAAADPTEYTPTKETRTLIKMDSRGPPKLPTNFLARPLPVGTSIKSNPLATAEFSDDEDD